MKRTRMAWMVWFLLLGSVSIATAQEAKPATRVSRDLAELATRPSVAAFSVEPQTAPDSVSAWRPAVIGDWVTIDAAAEGEPTELEAELIALGASHTAIAGRLVSARLPIAVIPQLEGVTSLRFARRAIHMANAGLVTTQGDKVMRADIARNLFDLDGSGVMVGALSDSFDCLSGAATDMASGDLPPTVTVVQDLPGCPDDPLDEGRALLQIVHDIAPEAALAFATAFTGQAGFANNIRALRDAGAKVIVDDIIYFAEPMFQDGVIAQAVDEVVADGVAYFSAAGNNARKGYDHAFAPGTPLAPGTFGPDFLGGTPHVFSSTANVLQQITIPSGSGFLLVLQWDSPSFSAGGTGATNDLDVYLLQFGQIVISETTDNISSGDPVEVLSVFCPGGPCPVSIMIVNRAGANPGRLKYVLFTFGGNPTLSPAINSGTIYGHANANGAIAVGAANYKTPTTLESFSSGGTTPVLFDTDGNLLPSADPRQFKPWIVALDGVDTTFFGSDDGDAGSFPNFFGTSAAAPHAAAVAALMLQGLPSLTPAEIGEALKDTALNMGPAGFDTNTGYGLIRADVALNALHIFSIEGPTGTPNPVIPSGSVSVSVTAEDNFGHTLTYLWTSTCTGGLPAGSFNAASSPVTTWTAPFNATGLSQTCALKVTVTDGHGFTRTGTHTATVLSVPRITSVSPGVAPVGATVVITGMSLANASWVTFSGPVTAPPTTVTATSVTVVVPDDARTGVFSVTTPADVGASPTIFKVAPKITSFTPPGGVVGGSADVVAVTGTNLLAGSGTPIVKIGAMTVPQALITLHTLTALQFKVPLGAVTAKIGVTTVDGTTLSVANLTVAQPPRATAFSPNPAPVGTTVTITGTNLTGVTEVTFSGGGGPVVPLPGGTATSLKAMVPAGATTGPVTLVNPIGTTTSTVNFRVAPKITGFTPDTAVGGSPTEVNVTGTNLQALTGTSTLKVGTMTVPPGLITGSSPVAFQFKVPLGALTAKIAITTVDGTTLSATNLTVQQPPRATAFSPNPAPVGTTVTITGTNLTGVTEVTFSGGGGPVVPLPGGTATSLKAMVPAGATTGPVTLVNPIGTTTSTVNFRVAPKITGFTPDTAVGGSPTEVNVTGTNLQALTGTSTLKVGTMTVPPGLITGSSPVAFQFKVPLGALTAKIAITTVDGTTLSATNLTVQQPPRATAFSPNPAPVGTTVTITGTNLTGVTEVTFSGGGGPVVPLPGGTATSLKAMVPAGATTGPVTLVNPIGTTTSTVNFRVAPKIDSFTPNTAVGGSTTVIDVTGTNLQALTGTQTVKVGTMTVPAGLITGNSPTLLQFKVPLGAGTAKIAITTVDGTALSLNNLTVQQPPRATAFSPNPAPVGATVTITGTNLTGVNEVTFSGGVGPVVPLPGGTATSLKAMVPAGATTGLVTLANPTGTAPSTGNFRVAPKIDSFTPNTAVGGSTTVIDVTGTNLQALTGTQTVKVGTMTVPAGLITGNSPTLLQFKVPLGAGTAKIAITTVDGTALSLNNLTVQQPPRATAFSPNPAPVGTTVTITGTNLTGVNEVTFSGGVGPVVPLPGGTATSLKAMVPAGATTGLVTLANPTGTAPSTGNFRVAPKIDSFTPNTAVGGSTTVIDVTGTNLQALTGTQTVKVGTMTVPAGLITGNSPTLLQFKVPLGAGTAKIAITTVDGTALSLNNLTVQQPPRATAFSPNPAPVGATVTITGTNLTGVNEVTFSGGVGPVVPLPGGTATSLKAMVPAGATTGPVTLANAIGTTTSTVSYKVLPKIASFIPEAELGSQVVVNGTNLKTGGATPVVKVGTVAAVVVDSSPTEVTFTVPTLAATGKITITTADGTTTSLAALTVMPGFIGF